MIKNILHFSGASISLIVLAFSGYMNSSAASEIDPVSFCNTSCRPALCSTDAQVKKHCEVVCGPVIDQVAALQVKEDMKLPAGSPLDKDRLENSKKGTAIYQCLNPDRNLDPAPLSDTSAAVPVNSDLCAAALNAEMQAMTGQHRNLAESLKDLGK